VEADVKRVVVALAVVAVVIGFAIVPVGPHGSRAGAATPWKPPPVRHVFVINLENKGFDETFGPNSPAPYLSRTLRAKGQLLTQYYGTAHASLPNYIAQISGQGPNVVTQSDCQVFTDFARVATVSYGQAVGQGCVYPADVPTIATELSERGLSWKGYMEDMGSPCRHPAIGERDPTQQAKVGDQYAARHNPFVYFHAIIDNPSCRAHVVPLERLTMDLRASSTTPNLTYITPNLCNDGHDAPCVDGRPGGLASADAWLATWVPKILASAAFRRDGVLVVTFDEAEIEGDGAAPDASACCGEGPGPNTPLPGIFGLGGGRTGAVVVSRWARPGTTNATPYNHYSLLRTIEDLFGVAHLGYSDAPSVHSFGRDVFGGPK
jgi:hypothetical protein